MLVAKHHTSVRSFCIARHPFHSLPNISNSPLIPNLGINNIYNILIVDFNHMFKSDLEHDKNDFNSIKIQVLTQGRRGRHTWIGGTFPTSFFYTILSSASSWWLAAIK